MIDIKKWIYSQDIADWILENVVLSTTEQIDCICTAPHRTMREKLAELKKHWLKVKGDDKSLLNDRIERMETILSTIDMDTLGQKTFY